MIALDVCAGAGVPVVPQKIEGPATELTFLGIELDTGRMELRLPKKTNRQVKGVVRPVAHAKIMRKARFGVRSRPSLPCVQGSSPREKIPERHVWPPVFVPLAAAPNLPE